MEEQSICISELGTISDCLYSMEILAENAIGKSGQEVSRINTSISIFFQDIRKKLLDTIMTIKMDKQ